MKLKTDDPPVTFTGVEPRPTNALMVRVPLDEVAVKEMLPTPARFAEAVVLNTVPEVPESDTAFAVTAPAETASVVAKMLPAVERLAAVEVMFVAVNVPDSVVELAVLNVTMPRLLPFVVIVDAAVDGNVKAPVCV